MNLLTRVLIVLGLGISCGWTATLGVGTNPGHATNITIVNVEEKDGYVILTFSDDLSQGPPCAAKHRNALVIGNGNDSMDAIHARSEFKLGEAVKVWGAGECKRVSGYETLASIELMN